jgi:ParB family chromosome partitioning protein
MNEVTTIPFSHLILSPSNARKTAANPAKDKELRAAIQAQGILQNLVVKPNGAPNQYEVTAGGRRYKSLQAIIEDKVEGFDENYPVPCMVIERADFADEASLTENVCREEMDLVDQFEAYEKLHTLHGLSVKELARHFGKSQQDVRKALKLGGIHPDLLGQFRARKLDIDDLMAFALESDPEQQLAVYESLKKSGQPINDYNIRRRITSSDTTNADARVKFIGLKEYKAAGGTTANDIFQNTIYILDEPLLDRLVEEKLDQVSTDLKKEWSWVEVDLDFHEWDIHEYEVLVGEPNAPEELTQQLVDLTAQNDVINEAYDNDTEDDLAPELKAISGTILDDIVALESKIAQYREFTDEQKSQSGCIVTLSQQGELKVYKGVINPEENGEETSEETTNDASNSHTGKGKKPEEKKLSQALQDDLSRYKHMVAKWSLVLGSKKGSKNNPQTHHHLGYNLVLFQVCYDALKPAHAYWNQPLDITPRETGEETSIKDRDNYEAHTQLKRLRADLDLSWMDKDPRKAFANFCELDSETKEFLVAYVAAVTLKRECFGEQDGWVDLVLDSQINLLADHWRPTKENFFKRATKPFLLEAGNKLFNADWSAQHSKEKKSVLAEQLHDCTQELDSPQVWLPPGMEPELSTR